jgi:hypothetical protein
MPAHAGIQLSPLSRKRLKKLDSRVRGNERAGTFAALLLPFAGPAAPPRAGSLERLTP